MKNIPRKLLFVFMCLIASFPLLFAQEDIEKRAELFVQNGMIYNWSFENQDKALFSCINKELYTHKLKVHGNIKVENGLAKIFSKKNSSFVFSDVNIKNNEGVTLWMRLQPPLVVNNKKNKSSSMTFLSIHPLDFVLHKEASQNKLGLGINLNQQDSIYELEPTYRYILSSGSWVQIAMTLAVENNESKIKLYYREEKPNQMTNNWNYVGRIITPVLKFGDMIKFGNVKSENWGGERMTIDELRIYNRTLSLQELESLWPKYKDFQPLKNSPPGVVIDYSPSRTRRFVAGSPSIVMLEDGTYIAKGDDYGPAVGISELVRVYKSVDKGNEWTQISEIEGLTWASMFVHQNIIYMLGTSAGHRHGNVVIFKSSDGGYTWTKPVNRLNGRLTSDLSYHTAPVPVIFHNNRVWKTMEDEKGAGGWGRNFRAFLMSASLDSDLLNADNWTFSNSIGYDSTRLEGNFNGWLEGNAVLMPNGSVGNVLRVDTKTGGGKAALIEYNKSGTVGSFNGEGFVDFPGGSTKFHILFDQKSGLYWALSNAVPEKHTDALHSEGLTRNTLVLMTSDNLRKWNINKILLYHPDIAKHSFQYPSFIIDGEDIVFVARTAYDDGIGGAFKQHDVNFFTFHRIKNFRDLAKERCVSF